jgi:hypothetical protein
LRIDAYPWAKVMLGSRELGITPLTVELPVGEQRLVLENDTLNTRRPIVVTITAGKETARYETLASSPGP